MAEDFAKFGWNPSTEGPGEGEVDSTLVDVLDEMAKGGGGVQIENKALVALVYSLRKVEEELGHEIRLHVPPGLGDDVLPK